MATAISNEQLVGYRNQFVSLLAAWRQSFTRTARRPSTISAQTAVKPVLDIQVAPAEESCATLLLTGELTHVSAPSLIAAAEDVRNNGAEALIVDLANVTRLSIAGLFALHNAACIVAGKTPIDDTNGWSALRQMRAQGFAANSGDLRLIHASAAVEHFVAANGVSVER